MNVIRNSDRELATLTAEYTAWNVANELDLGSADEHMFDENLTEEQREWIRNFCERWEDASLVWDSDGPHQGRDKSNAELQHDEDFAHLKYHDGDNS